MPTSHTGSAASGSMTGWLVAALAPLLLYPVGGCQRGEITAAEGDPTAEELIAFYRPRQIRILEFSKPASFDNDAIPDGIAVWIHALDGAGNPGRAYGTFLFELYSYRPASQDHKGELLQQWSESIHSIEDQKLFWDRFSDGYEFQLLWEGVAIPPQQRYILTASYQAPGAERLFDTYQFEFRVQREEILEALSQDDS